MSKTTNDQVPEGFERLPLGLGFTDNLQPLYRRVSGDEVSFGLLVEPQHSNMMGICHGGVLMTLADITAATGTNVARGVAAGSPTIQLSKDTYPLHVRGSGCGAPSSMSTPSACLGFAVALSTTVATR